MQKILVIEDDTFLRELIVQKLLKEGYEIVEAVDGEDGIKKVTEENPDIILLDIILPGIDGFEVLKKIKEDEKVKDIPVIILSNLGQQDDIDKGIKLGAKDYLIKAEFTPGEIVEKVKGVLE
ncbi:response regulator [Patescibacteria group bacterium]|nr:response regulator [Patescibacteria group bacterium]